LEGSNYCRIHGSDATPVFLGRKVAKRAAKKAAKKAARKR
jgi:uncharacterized membrane protein